MGPLVFVGKKGLVLEGFSAQTGSRCCHPSSAEVGPESYP